MGYELDCMLMDNLTDWWEYKVDDEFGIDWYWFWSNLKMENVMF